MTDEQDTPQQADADPQAASKLVPVGESIRYRRRAQQAESRCEELEQQLEELQSQMERRSDELAAAESQRDETLSRLTETDNARRVERRLAAAGVTDFETAGLLLSRRVDLTEELDDEALDRRVEQLLLDKPFLRSTAAAGAALPPVSASPRAGDAAAGQLAHAAERAAQTGNRRDVADYLRLRRSTAAS